MYFYIFHAPTVPGTNQQLYIQVVFFKHQLGRQWYRLASTVARQNGSKGCLVLFNCLICLGMFGLCWLWEMERHWVHGADDCPCTVNSVMLCVNLAAYQLTTGFVFSQAKFYVYIINDINVYKYITLHELYCITELCIRHITPHCHVAHLYKYKCTYEYIIIYNYI